VLSNHQRRAGASQAPNEGLARCDGAPSSPLTDSSLGAQRASLIGSLLTARQGYRLDCAWAARRREGEGRQKAKNPGSSWNGRLVLYIQREAGYEWTSRVEPASPHHIRAPLSDPSSPCSPMDGLRPAGRRRLLGNPTAARQPAKPAPKHPRFCDLTGPTSWPQGALETTVSRLPTLSSITSVVSLVAG